VPRLELNIEVADGERRSGAGPAITGSVRDDRGSAVSFVGWVGLLALLEQALDYPAEAVEDAS
jgi:hypothetical protein